MNGMVLCPIPWFSEVHILHEVIWKVCVNAAMEMCRTWLACMQPTPARISWNL